MREPASSYGATRRIKPKVAREQTIEPVTQEERVQWARTRWHEARRRAQQDPTDSLLAAAVTARRHELDLARHALDRLNQRSA